MIKKFICMVIFLVGLFIAMPSYAFQFAELNEQYNAIQTLDLYNKYQIPMYQAYPGFTQIDHSDPDYDFYTSEGRTMIEIMTNKNNYTVSIRAFLTPGTDISAVSTTGFIIFKIAADLYQFDDTEFGKEMNKWVDYVVKSAIDNPGKIICVPHNNRVLIVRYERFEDGTYGISVVGSVDG